MFEISDEVMVHVKRGRFPIGTYSKLKMSNSRPCKILRKFDSGNSYEVELPNDMDIYHIFNVSYLYEYHELYDEFIIPNDYPKKKIEDLE